MNAGAILAPNLMNRGAKYPPYPAVKPLAGADESSRVPSGEEGTAEVVGQGLLDSNPIKLPVSSNLDFEKVSTCKDIVCLLFAIAS